MDDTPQCDLVGIFSVLVQSLMGALALSYLLYLRFRERPLRPWRVWFFDVSKSVFSSFLQHFLNIFIALFFGETGDTSCGFYVVVSSADTFFGTFLNFLFHRAFQVIFVTKMGYIKLKSGYYGANPNVPDLSYWIPQMIAWLSIVVVTKLILAFGISLWIPVLTAFTEWIMLPLEKYPRIELLFVMVFIPLFLNLFYFGVTYHMLKMKKLGKETADIFPDLPKTKVLLNSADQQVDESEFDCVGTVSGLDCDGAVVVYRSGLWKRVKLKFFGKRRI
ncbi:hypothetical protein P9112_009043 [Eukaryota sp. TZLM1-RC]